MSKVSELVWLLEFLNGERDTARGWSRFPNNSTTWEEFKEWTLPSSFLSYATGAEAGPTAVPPAPPFVPLSTGDVKAPTPAPFLFGAPKDTTSILTYAAPLFGALTALVSPSTVYVPFMF